MNNIHSLPDGIHQLVQLEVLDLSYNFLTEHSFPPEFFFLGKSFLYFEFKLIFLSNKENLKALYLSDNELENVPQGIGNLKNLLIVRLINQFIAIKLIILCFANSSVYVTITW